MLPRRLKGLLEVLQDCLWLWVCKVRIALNFSQSLASSVDSCVSLSGLGMGMGMVQSIVSAVVDIVPPLIPPPVWNNMPLPCAPMITGATVCVCKPCPGGANALLCRAQLLWGRTVSHHYG